MAVIKSSIQITDGMTPVFKSMTSAMNIVLSSFESLQRVSGNAIDTNSIVAARTALNSANTAITQVEDNLRASASAQSDLNNKMVSGTSAAGGLLDQIKAMAATYVSIQGVKGLLAMADEATNTYSRLDLMNDGLQTTKELQDKIFESANRSYASYKDTADAVAKMGNLAGEAFNNNDEIIQFTELLNKNFIIAGTNAEGIKSAMLQLTQAMGSGVLRGEEFNAMLENGGQFAQYLADYLQVPKGALKDMAAQGQISAEVVKNAMFAATDSINKKFNGMNNVFKDIWNIFKNEATRAMEPVLLQLREISSSEDFKQFAKDAGAALGSIAASMVVVFKGLGAVANFVRKNWAYIEPVIAAVTAATVVYAASLAWANREVAINAAMTVWKAVCDWAETAAIIAMTLAQDGLNAALALCPITWIIYAIIALIAIVYLAVAAYNEFTGSALSATGLVAAAFVVLGSVVWNVIAYMWNTFAAFCEFIVEAFFDPVTACKRLSINLALNFIKCCLAMTSGWDGFATAMANAFISAINAVIIAWNGLMKILPDNIKMALSFGVGGEVGHVGSISSGLNNAKGMLSNALSDLGTPKVSLPRMGSQNVGENAAAAYKWGETVGKTGAEAFKKATELATPEAGELGAGTGGGAGKGGKGATEKTAKDIANQLQGDEEYLKMLRTIAERDVINKFTTASIALDIKNDNNINSALDLDGIVGGLTDKLTEQMIVAAEGVHV